jgi:hypothetical protein
LGDLPLLPVFEVSKIRRAEVFPVNVVVPRQRRLLADDLYDTARAQAADKDLALVRAKSFEELRRLETGDFVPEVRQFQCWLDSADLAQDHRASFGTPSEIRIESTPGDAHFLLKLCPEGFWLSMADVLDNGGRLDAAHGHLGVDPHPCAAGDVDAAASEFDSFSTAEN